MSISACGVFNCGTCDHQVRGRCPGCANGNALLVADDHKQCGIYECVVSRGLVSCAACSSIICQFPKNLDMICPVRASFEKKRCYKRKMHDHYSARLEKSGEPEGEKISDRTVIRLRWYLAALDDFLARGITRISSQDIAGKCGVKPGLIRRDLSHFGEFGRPSIGYDAAFLRKRLAEILHLDHTKNVVWVGYTRLADDSSLIKRFAERNCHIVALFDTTVDNLGMKIGNLEVLPMKQLSRTVGVLNADAAVLAVPEHEAQDIAEALVLAGVHAILNLTPVVLVTPPGTMVRNVDVVAELFALSYYCGERQERTEALSAGAAQG